MAAPQYNVQKLIENIKNRCFVPTNQLTFTNDRFAAMATDEMQTMVVPLMMELRQEYFVSYVDVTATASGEIEFPDDTVVSTIRNLVWVQNLANQSFVNLPRINFDNVAGSGIMAAVAGFYVQGNSLMLTPIRAIPQNSQLRIYYFKRALDLIDPANYGRIVAIDVPSKTIQLSNVPLAWNTDTILNGVNGKSPFNTTNVEMSIVSISSPSVVVNNIDGLVVGNYITEQGYSALPQIPQEAHAYLAQLTAVKALEALGDTNGMKAAQAKAEELAKNLRSMMMDRVQGAPVKAISPSNGLRNSGLGRNRWGC